MKIPIFLFLIAFTVCGYGQSTPDPASTFVYSANSGWIDFQPSEENGVVLSATYLSGNAYGVNFGWMNLGDGTPADGVNYTNDSGTDYGVNHDHLGNLSGYAYAANIGWVNFGWTDSNDPNSPTIDPFTGSVSGYAYSANIGWIHLGSDQLRFFPLWDTDEDGISDDFERQYFTGLDVAGTGTDFDEDGQSDASEAISGSDPKDDASYFKITNQSYANGLTKLTVTFTSALAREYRLEYTGDFNSPWENSSLGTFTPDSGDTTTKTFTVPSSDRRFVRVIVEKPFAP